MLKIRVRRGDSKPRDSGYMLLVLMLAVAMLTITMLGVARNYRRSIQRDREVEMIHRGAQYARAVERYYHKYGTYPISIEQLQSSNNLRFLRKKYKDPMSPDGEWKLARITDIKLTAGGGLTPAAGTVNGTAINPATAGSTGGSANNATTNGGNQSPSTNTSNQNTTNGTNSTDASSTGASSTGTSAFGNNNSTSSSTQGTGAPGGSIGGGPGANGTAANAVLGGGPLLGVVSKQTTQGIHSFGDKSKYSEWFFIYDPTQDKGQLIVGPYNPNMFVGAANSGLGNSTKSGSGTPNSGSTTTPSTTSPSTSTPSTNTPTTTP
jgi:type II secretory pathway pseudopilin PulG